MCSFCGVNTHDYRDCPVMHQYIREQADALAQRRLENTNNHRSGRGMKSQGNYHLIRDRPLEEGDQMKVDQSLGQGPSKKETQKQKIPTKSGMTGLGHQYPMGGMAPGGGGGTPPPGRGGPPDDKRDDESDEEENEEDDTDEETVSVTSSSQVSANRARPSYGVVTKGI